MREECRHETQNAEKCGILADFWWEAGSEVGNLGGG